MGEITLRGVTPKGVAVDERELDEEVVRRREENDRPGSERLRTFLGQVLPA